jgi:hypothetical protein
VLAAQKPFKDLMTPLAGRLNSGSIYPERRKIPEVYSDRRHSLNKYTKLKLEKEPGIFMSLTRLYMNIIYCGNSIKKGIIT